MRHTKFILAAAAIAFAGTTANAGGLEPAPIVVPEEPFAVTSVNSGYIVLGLLAALVAASGSF